ncbi:MAG: DUF4430 domain-containing protein [Thermofilum sp.]
MSARTATEKLVVAALLVWAVAATSAAAYLYLENARLERELEASRTLLGNAVVVNLGIDYGNGTVVWYNGTLLPRGATVFSALLSVASVEYQVSPMGVYVTSVNGVAERILSKNEGYSWLWYYFDASKGQLVMGPVAADKYKLSSGDVIVWRYEHWRF